MRGSRVGMREGRKSEVLELWLVGEREQATRCGDGFHRAMQRNSSALERGFESGIAEPHPGEGLKMGGDDDVDVPVGSLEAYLDIVGPQHQPPVARAAIGFGHATEIEANDEALRGYLRRIDLPAHSPDQHFGIEVVGTDQPLAPALAPHAHQLHDRAEILARRRQSIEMPFAPGLAVNVDDASLCELLQSLRQHRPRYQRRAVEQLAEGPGAEAQLPDDDRGPTVAKNFSRFGNGAELGVGEHGRHNPPPAAPRQVRFSYLNGGLSRPGWIETDHQGRSIMRFSLKVASTGLALTVILLSLAHLASAGP